MKNAMFYIICYDSPSNKRRRKLHKLLKNYAVAVQKSVFETFLDLKIFNEMMNKIYKLMDASVDSVRVYGLSRRAQRKMSVIGFPGRLKDPDFYFVSELANKEKESLNSGNKFAEDTVAQLDKAIDIEKPGEIGEKVASNGLSLPGELEENREDCPDDEEEDEDLPPWL